MTTWLKIIEVEWVWIFLCFYLRVVITYMYVVPPYVCSMYVCMFVYTCDWMPEVNMGVHLRFCHIISCRTQTSLIDDAGWTVNTRDLSVSNTPQHWGYRNKLPHLAHPFVCYGSSEILSKSFIHKSLLQYHLVHTLTSFVFPITFDVN